MAAPDLAAVKTYLGANNTWTDTEISAALATETAAQARVCRVPASDAAWPADLATALCRRVHRNLAIKALPLGYTAGIDGGISWIGSNDAEIRRLEAPFRKRAVR
jgi:hypothetical protein